MFDTVEAFYRPGTDGEALRLLRNGKGRARVVAGGTDLVVEADRSIRFLIDITHAGLSYIRRRGNACVIGATTTMADLEGSPAIRALASGILARAASTCGSTSSKIQTRNGCTNSCRLIVTRRLSSWINATTSEGT
jgi:CO/xanthine dehydrogenase FAD-binding subunit